MRKRNPPAQRVRCPVCFRANRAIDGDGRFFPHPDDVATINARGWYIGLFDSIPCEAAGLTIAEAEELAARNR